MLDVSDGGHLFSVNPDGSDKQVLVTGTRVPDGIAVDAAGGSIYWTEMGHPPDNDGSIERSDLDGGNRASVVPSGGTHTPKQLQLEPLTGKLYWSDREGMRVMRCNLDGSNVETLVQTGDGEEDRQDQTRHCVGIAVDHAGGHIYWTQKGPSNGEVGKILRAGIELPAGEAPDERSDIEVLFDGLPEPIDLDLDLAARQLYWTDRGDPPRGNTVNRAPLDVANGHRDEPEILLTHLEEGIGIALDRSGGRMFVTDMAGNVVTAALDGSNRRPILAAQGNLTGIAYAEVSSQ
ncbi:MAG: 3-hydroxyacyl-CoA dehydrogenase [Solirubrobacteraceae bacterium]